MLYLLLAVGCSLVIAMIFKHAGQRGLGRVALLTTNYAVAALLALAFIAQDAGRAAGGLALEPGLALLGVGTGVLFIAGFFLLALATEEAGMSIATGVMRVSVVVPFLASWLVWGEVPTGAQGAGLACAGAAFFMIAARGREDASERARPPAPATRCQAGPAASSGGSSVAARGNARPRGPRLKSAPEEKAAAAVAGPAAEGRPPGPEEQGKQRDSHAGTARTLGVLALLFVSGGLVDTCMKTFDEVYAEESSRALFLLLIFGVAFLVGVGVLMRRRARRPPAGTLAWGALLGVANYGSVEFILRAIRALSGPFVFPANNIAVVVGAALLGVWLWGERLSLQGKAGLGLAALALFLLRP